MLRILHCITHDKFTIGYITFMKEYVKGYEHIFLLSEYNCGHEDIKDRLRGFEGINYYRSGKELAFGGKIRKILKIADKIIISGVFGIEKYAFFWPYKTYMKVYLHYWGGDFYQLRDEVLKKDFRSKYSRYALIRLMKKSYGAIFLIPGENDFFESITGIVKRNVYVAAMPVERIDYNKFRGKLPGKTINIVLGNSATKENMHKDMIERFVHLKNENIRLYCPLSYGDKEYSTEIVEYGKKLLGDKFCPLLSWMSAEEYYSFLSSCDVGVFNCNRQQGMGNIIALLSMGKKVYMRNDTSMYRYFTESGFKCYSISLLDEANYDELRFFPEREHNEVISDTFNTYEKIREQWVKILEE